MFAVAVLLLLAGASMDHQESGQGAPEPVSVSVDEQSVTVCGDCGQAGQGVPVQRPVVRKTPKIVVRVSPRSAMILNRPIRVSLSIRIENGGDYLWCPEYEIEWGDGTKTGPNGGDCSPYEEASEADRVVQVLPDKARTIPHSYVTNGEFLIVTRFIKAGRVIRQHEGVRIYITGGGQ